jgi:hypothetical protein
METKSRNLSPCPDGEKNFSEMVSEGEPKSTKHDAYRVQSNQMASYYPDAPFGTFGGIPAISVTGLNAFFIRFISYNNREEKTFLNKSIQRNKTMDFL